MAGYKNVQELTADPDFWAPDTTDADRSFALSKVDKKFAAADPTTQAKLLKSLGDQNRQGQQVAQKEMAGAEQNQSIFNKYIAQPLNNIVGMGMEAASSGAIPFARMAQGEPMKQAFDLRGITDTIGAGGVAQQTREQAAMPVVPQEPWQAALLATGPLGKALAPAVPALGAATKTGMAARSLLAGGLGAAGEAALGDQSQSVGQRALLGGLKAGAMQGGMEAIGGLSSFLDRHLPGAKARINAEDVGRVQEAAGKTAPELALPKGTSPANVGQFYEGNGAKVAAEQAFANKVEPLDDIVSQNPKWIHSQELYKAWRTLVKQYKDKPGGTDLLLDIAPDPVKGFLPSQAAKILARTREALVGGGNERMSGHMAQEMVDNVLMDVIRNMPADQAKVFLQAREGFASAAAVRELFGGAFKPGNKGWQLDMRGPQQAIEGADITRRLPEGGKTLREALMRGKGAPPGSADVYPGEGQYMPYPSAKGVGVFAGRKIFHGNKYVGQKPLSTPPGKTAKAGALGALLTGKASHSGQEE